MTQTTSEQKPKKKPGRPRLKTQGQCVTVYLEESHRKALDGFRIARGFKSLSAAVRGLLDIVIATSADHAAVRKCPECDWGTADPAVEWCPECESRL